MANRRHEKHDAILKELLLNAPLKAVARKLDVSLGVVSGIAERYTETVRVPKRNSDHGEGQLSFLHVWKRLKPFRRP